MTPSFHSHSLRLGALVALFTNLACVRFATPPAKAPATAPSSTSTVVSYPPLLLPRAVVIATGDPDGAQARTYERVFASLGLPMTATPAANLAKLLTASSHLIVVVTAASARALSEAERKDLLAAINLGAIVITEEVTPLTLALGITAGAQVESRHFEEVAYASMPIEWAQPEQVTTLVPPPAARVLTVALPAKQPVALYLELGRGRVIVLATPLDAPKGAGYGRFPFLPQTLRTAGLTLPWRSARLAAFFDYGYRTDANADTLAQRWRQAGISAVHVGAWGFWEREPTADAYLERLIAASHRQGISVYAWLELPHVSVAFWNKHPRWREKTATLADAQLDWRYLMNLQNTDCQKQVITEIKAVMVRFDWDGVNLSELYFDSPLGPVAPAQMTPFSSEGRKAYKTISGIDPTDFFRQQSSSYWKRNPTAWAAFVDWRVDLERQLNEQFLGVLQEIRTTTKPHLALALTYVDNLYDPNMREAVGADVKVMLPLLDRYDFTFIIEDPMTTWNLGPERYSELASSYSKLTSKFERLGVDINVVERMAPVFPTAKQTGSELAQLLYHAGKSYDTVMVYAEQSIEDHDLEFIAPALAADAQVEPAANGLWVKTRHALAFRVGQATDAIRVDGHPWPAINDTDVILPLGEHLLSVATEPTTKRPRLVQITALLQSARYTDEGSIEIDYSADGRAFAAFDELPKSATLDDAPFPFAEPSFMLPRGNHRLEVRFIEEAAHQP